MKVVIETPYGKIESGNQPTSITEVQEWFEQKIGHVKYLTIDTLDGPVIIPEATLNASLIRLIEE